MQVDFWRQKGHVVEIFCTNFSGNKSDYGFKCYSDFGRFFIRRDIVKDLSSFGPDIVYFRYSAFGFTLLKILSQYKCIGEANTFEVEEFWGLFKKYKRIKFFLLWLANKYLRPIIILKSKGLVTVTHQMAIADSNKLYNKHVIGIPNGINTTKYKTLKRPSTDSSTQLFFMGSPNQPWHGVDLIEALAKELPHIEFHIVGLEGEGLNNVHYHGYLKSDKYMKLLENCHICIGSLALFRNGMDEGSPLKVREYIALGFPVVVGYEDTSIIDSGMNYSWFKKVDFKGDSLAHIAKELDVFCSKSKDFVVSEEDKYFFSLEHTEGKRLSFFDDVYRLQGEG
ncbi:glycosyltransferase family protein [Motiliproteus coralliicola]|nr:glycosyltransferase [Motiliproteus coralliicola]